MRVPATQSLTATLGPLVTDPSYFVVRPFGEAGALGIGIVDATAIGCDGLVIPQVRDRPGYAVEFGLGHAVIMDGLSDGERRKLGKAARPGSDKSSFNEVWGKIVNSSAATRPFREYAALVKGIIDGGGTQEMGAVVSVGGTRKARQLLHAVIHPRGMPDEKPAGEPKDLPPEEVVQLAVQNSLRVAAENDLDLLVFPTLGTNPLREPPFPYEASAAAMLGSLRVHWQPAADKKPTKVLIAIRPPDPSVSREPLGRRLQVFEAFKKALSPSG